MKKRLCLSVMLVVASFVVPAGAVTWWMKWYMENDISVLWTVNGWHLGPQQPLGVVRPHLNENEASS